MSVPKLLGLPWDGSSSFLRGPAGAPSAVRAALHGGSANYTTELGVQVDPDLWIDLGDVDIPTESAEQAHDLIRSGADAAIADGSPLVSIGGDHFVTWPVVEAIRAHHEQLTILHFDAHPDLYDELDGNRWSHACPFARIMEAGFADRLVQLGIRTATPHQREQAERFGVEIHDLRSWDGVVPELSGAVYVSIDVDALDPAFAPGISHFEPGGMSSRQLFDSIHQLAAMDVTVVGADVVEINVERDLHEMTAMVGAKLVRELLGLMLD